MKNRKLVVAIDGPAASGKSTTAKFVAAELGYLHVDTGAMYRAMTLKVLRSGIETEDFDSISRLLNSTHVALVLENGSLKIMLDGEDVSDDVRSPDVTKNVSAVSSISSVRAAMVREQRALGISGGIVLEGRDIGTVVFPNADLKIFMKANIEARARRRLVELNEKGVATSLDVLMAEIKERDRLDSTRDESPLRKASDAIELDTSDMTIEEQVDFVVKKAKVLIESEA